MSKVYLKIILIWLKYLKLYMSEQRQDDQLEPIYNSSVPIQDVALKTNRELWTIETGDGRGSRRSMGAARHDDDDDDIMVEKTNDYY